MIAQQLTMTRMLNLYSWHRSKAASTMATLNAEKNYHVRKELGALANHYSKFAHVVADAIDLRIRVSR